MVCNTYIHTHNIYTYVQILHKYIHVRSDTSTHVHVYTRIYTHVQTAHSDIHVPTDNAPSYTRTFIQTMKQKKQHPMLNPKKKPKPFSKYGKLIAKKTHQMQNKTETERKAM